MKLVPNNRSLSSSTPRTPAAPVPKSDTKTSIVNSAMRRKQPEKSLTQSVPNFSNLPKKTAKPSCRSSKTTLSQLRNYTRSKSSKDEATIVKEDKSHGSQQLRKGSANPDESREMSPLDTDNEMTPIKFGEAFEHVGAQPFLRKGSRMGFVARESIARQKASVRSEL